VAKAPRQTFEKMQRERAVKERRARKLAKKQERREEKQRAALGLGTPVEPAAEPPDVPGPTTD
jgi:hypothetical protein